MTEQERRRRRREAERQMRARAMARGKEKQRGGWFAFRAYVTVVLVGACFLLSLFHTETSERVCNRVKEAIVHQMPAEQVADMRDKTVAFFREQQVSLPVFRRAKQVVPSEKDPQSLYRPDTEESP